MSLRAALAGASATVALAWLAPAAVLANGLPDLSGEYPAAPSCATSWTAARPACLPRPRRSSSPRARAGKFRMLFRLANGTADVLYEGILKRVTGSDQVGDRHRLRRRLRQLGGDPPAPDRQQRRPALLQRESQFFTNDFPGSGGAVNFGTCKYVYQRVAASKTVVPKCKVSPFGAE